MLSSLVSGILLSTTVTSESLLKEMTDLTRLTRAANPAYKCIQASSYDRASTVPGNDQWFANGDYGQYIRTETRRGHTEYVMCDFAGPGALVRFWSANPMGIVHFYLDGATEPTFSASMAELLTGKVPGYPAPFSYDAANGKNLYFPIPFAKNLVVTMEADNKDVNPKGLYYHLDARIYEAGTPVTTFIPGSLSTTAIANEGKALLSDRSLIGVRKASKSIPAHQLLNQVVKSSRPSMIQTWVVNVAAQDKGTAWSDPRRLHNILNHLEVRLSFDGQETVSVPLPEFFGAGILPATYRTLAAQCDDKGNFVMRLPMPFRRTASLQVVNHNAFPVKVTSGYRLAEGPSNAQYVLHAQWSTDYKPSRPMRDMTFADFEGEGRYVGTVEHVQNPDTGWWGEGDEKIFVDKESFPSWFGTGTEDYFGYAWSTPKKFEMPYHAQPRCDGPANAGQIGNVRWHLFDDIPFENHIKFSLEMWHWRECASRFSGTSFWYAKPSKWKAPRVNPSLLELLEFKRPAPVAGAIEGEKMAQVSRTGGTTEFQGFADLSNETQLWWRDAKEGDRLVLEFEVKKAGTYQMTSSNCVARDYGIHELYLNGKSLGTKDFFNDGLAWKKFDWGKVAVRAGKSRLEVVSRGHNPQADPRNMFGLDYILLTPTR